MPKIISSRSREELNGISLNEVMERYGMYPVRRGGRATYYLCPLHKEKDASFSITESDEAGEVGIWKCFGCGAGGRGAITLAAALLKKDHKKDFIEVCKSLAKTFNLVIEYENSATGKKERDWVNSFFHRATKVEGPGERDIVLEYREMTLEDCMSLGCKTRVVPTERTGEHIEKECNWGKGFAPRYLEEDFSVKSVASMILPTSQPACQNGGGNDGSWKVRSTSDYPILAFHYTDQSQNGYYKIYEPLCLPTEEKGRRQLSKFYYYPESVDRPYNTKGEMWGDVSFMQAWRAGAVAKPTDPRDGEVREGMLPHPIIKVEEGGTDDDEPEKVWKFERLIICSGPKDGINAYYGSSCHVCWPLSESTPITEEMMSRLRRIANDIYILYDIDKTGVAGMNKAALQHLDLKVVYLPINLSSIRNKRSKKMCKDLAEWFAYYPEERGVSKHHAFEGMLSNAISMRFWSVIGARKNMAGRREPELKYEMLVDSVSQYAQARGFYLYQPKNYGEDGQLGRFFFHVRDNIAEMIEDKDVVAEIKQDMLSYLRSNYRYNSQSLRNAIITSRRIIPDTMFALATSDTTFISWGRDHCYFFFSNTAVRVDAESMEAVPYDTLPFYVNKKSIINFDYTWKGEEYFDIEYNSEVLKKLAERKAETLKKLREEGRFNEQTEKIENERYTRLERLWRYKLVIKGRKMNDMPPSFQIVYDTGRMYWKKEKTGMELTKEEKQRQDMYFISKCLSIGYMLHPFRDPTRIYAVVSTDYNEQQGKAQGRNMKSFIGSQLMQLVRKGLTIGGKNINTKPEKFAENFSNYELTEHQYMYLDDLKTELDVETLFNSGNMISKRKLYHDAVQIQGQWVPKIMMSTNNARLFDLSSPSQYERIWMQPHSDYYHAEDDRGQFGAYNPMIKFGRNVIEDMTYEERQDTMWWLMKNCQLYIRENRDHFESAIVRVDPDDKKQRERLEDLVHDRDMILYLQDFFSDASNYKVPISRKEMVLQFEVYKLKKNEGVEFDHVVGIRKEALGTKSVSTFGKCLKAYCENLPYEKRIVINPESLFGDEQRWKSEGVVSRQAMVSELSNYSDSMLGYDESKAKVKRGDERCYYFFKIHDIPKDKDILAT